MTGWLFPGGVVLLLILIGLIPLGLELIGRDGAFRLGLCVGAFPVARKSAATASDGGKRRLPKGPILQIILKNGYPILCRLLSLGRVEVLRLHFTAAFADPSTAAMAYAAAGVALDALARLGQGRVKHMDVKAAVDFESDTPAVDMHLKCSCRLYRLLYLAVLFGWGFLRDYLRMKKEDASSHVRTSDW